MKSPSIPIVGFFLISFGVAYSQSITPLYGSVRDSKDGSAIPFANIHFSSTKMGSVTNARGQFRIWIESSQSNDSLIVSFVGYKPVKQSISSITLTDSVTIWLTEQPITLQEVIITGETPFTFLKNSLKRTKSNSLSPLILNCYYREFVSKNGKYTKFADALVDYYIEYKSNKKTEVNVSVSESRAKHVPYKIDTKMGSDIDIPQQWDIERIPGLFETESKLDNVFKDGNDYTFDLFETSDGLGSEFYRVTFKPRQSVEKFLYEGEFYILKESGIIYSANYSLPKESLQYSKTFNLLGTKIKLVAFSAYVQYGLLGNKCYPRYCKASASLNVFDKKGTDITHVFTTEMITNSIQHENVKPFSNGAIWRKKSIYKRGNNYKTKFWEGKRGLLATEEEQKIIESLNSGDSSR